MLHKVDLSEMLKDKKETSSKDTNILVGYGVGGLVGILIGQELGGGWNTTWTRGWKR